MKLNKQSIIGGEHTTHYKMYKSGKLWMVAAIGALSIGASTVIQTPNTTEAAVTSEKQNGITITSDDLVEVPQTEDRVDPLKTVLQYSATNAQGQEIPVNVESDLDTTKLGQYSVKLSAVDGTTTASRTVRVVVVRSRITPQVSTTTNGYYPENTNIQYYWNNDKQLEHPQAPQPFGVPFFPQDLASKISVKDLSSTISSNYTEAFAPLIGANRTPGFAKQWVRSTNGDYLKESATYIGDVKYADGPYKGQKVDVNDLHFEKNTKFPNEPATLTAAVTVVAIGDQMTTAKTFDVVVTDGVPKINSDSNVHVKQSSETGAATVDSLLHYSASDAEEGTLKVGIEGSYNRSVPGKYPITMTATDKYGVTTTRQETITVDPAAETSFSIRYEDVDGNKLADTQSTTASLDKAATITTPAINNYAIQKEIVNVADTSLKLRSVVADFANNTLTYYSELNGTGTALKELPLSRLTSSQLLEIGITQADTGSVSMVSGNNIDDFQTGYEYAQKLGSLTFVYAKESATTLTAGTKTVKYGTKNSILAILKPTATDSVDGDISNHVFVSDDGGFNAKKAGTYTIKLGVTNSNGVTQTKTGHITVLPQPDAAPILTATNATVPAGSAKTITEILAPTATDAEDGDLTSQISVQNSGGFNATLAGDYTVTLGVMDTANHLTVGNYTITVTPVVKSGDDTTTTTTENAHTKLIVDFVTTDGTQLRSQSITTHDVGENFKVRAPKITGYTFISAKNGSLNGTFTTVPTKLTLLYAPDNQTAIITYIDDATKETLRTDTISGKTNSSSNYYQASIIQSFLNKGYTVITNDLPRNGLTFDDDTTRDQAYTVTLKEPAQAEVKTDDDKDVGTSTIITNIDSHNVTVGDVTIGSNNLTTGDTKATSDTTIDNSSDDDTANVDNSDNSSTISTINTNSGNSNVSGSDEDNNQNVDINNATTSNSNETSDTNTAITDNSSETGDMNPNITDNSITTGDTTSTDANSSSEVDDTNTTTTNNSETDDISTKNIDNSSETDDANITSTDNSNKTGDTTSTDSSSEVGDTNTTITNNSETDDTITKDTDNSSETDDTNNTKQETSITDNSSKPNATDSVKGGDSTNTNSSTDSDDNTSASITNNGSDDDATGSESSTDNGGNTSTSITNNGSDGDDTDVKTNRSVNVSTSNVPELPSTGTDTTTGNHLLPSNGGDAAVQNINATSTTHKPSTSTPTALPTLPSTGGDSSTLPQMGESRNNVLMLIGLSVAGVLGMIALSSNRKHKGI